MKITRKTVAFVTVIWTTAVLGQAQSQMELNEDACHSYQNADKKMNETYRKILTLYREDAIFIRALRGSQRAWLAFRDAELKAVYPESEESYGSIHPVCRCDELKTLTADRTRQLQVWIDGEEEGDACVGSVRIKPHDRHSEQRPGRSCKPTPSQDFKPVVGRGLLGNLPPRSLPRSDGTRRRRA